MNASAAPNRLAWFKSQEGRDSMIFIFVGLIWVSLGWILPIVKLKDKNVEVKLPWVFLLVGLGIMFPLFIAQAFIPPIPTNIKGTSMNAAGAAAPVVPLNVLPPAAV